MAALLKGSYRVIVPDLVGHGCDRGDTLLTSTTAAADDVAILLQELEVSSAAIVGLSMGGAVEQEFALRHPAQTRALGLCETSRSH